MLTIATPTIAAAIDAEKEYRSFVPAKQENYPPTKPPVTLDIPKLIMTNGSQHSPRGLPQLIPTSYRDEPVPATASHEFVSATVRDEPRMPVLTRDEPVPAAVSMTPLALPAAAPLFAVTNFSLSAPPHPSPRVSNELFSDIFPAQPPATSTPFSFPASSALPPTSVFSAPSFPIVPPAIDPKPPKSYSFRILFVDDDPLQQKVFPLTYFRCFANAVLVTAWNGKEALDILKRDKDGFNLIITDSVMPVMDGPTFLNELKKDPKLKKDAKVIGISGDDDLSKQLHNAGADSVLIKPYRPDHFKTTINGLFDISPLKE